jgi:hypothetical protein
MKHLIILSMALLSFLFGCGTKKAPATAAAAESPRFPETDNPQVKVVPVLTDTDFSVNTFFITDNKQEVYVLCSRDKPRPDPDYPGNYYEDIDYRLYCLDAHGQIKHHIDLPHNLGRRGGSIGWLDQRLMLLLGDYFWVLDPEKFTIREKIPVYDTEFFLSKIKVELMTPDEQRDGYQYAFDKMIEKGATCKWLDWTPGGQYFIWARDASGKLSAWSPISYEDTVVANLKKRFEPIVVPLNPGFHDGLQGGEMHIEDGPAQIREAAYLSAGTELDYPNYKKRQILNYELTLGSQKVHFSTTDKDRHNLRLRFSDNWMLSTEGGVAWLKYEGVLYRVE